MPTFDDLCKAIYAKDEKKIGQILKDDPSLATQKNCNGYTALHLAAVQGHMPKINLVIEKGADVKAVDKWGRTALHLAAIDGNLDAVKLLFPLYPAAADMKNKDGNTPRMSAKKGGHTKVVAYFDNPAATPITAVTSAVASIAVSGSSSAAEALVLASCPEVHHDEVGRICKAKKIVKAFGKAGDMVNSLAGGSNQWVGKWQAKVVAAASAVVNDRDAKRVKIICIEGGPQCDKELAHQPLLVKAVRQELGNPSFPVQVLWMSFADFKQDFA